MRQKAKRPSGFVSLLLLAAACLLLAVSLPNLGPVIRAAMADGISGTFTAERLSCVRHPGHESCEWLGSFRSADGRLLREQVRMYGSDRNALENGQVTDAVDVGNPGRVYSTQGSHEWVFTVLLLLGGYGILALLAKRHLMPPPLPGTRTAAVPG